MQFKMSNLKYRPVSIRIIKSAIDSVMSDGTFFIAYSKFKKPN